MKKKDREKLHGQTRAELEKVLKQTQGDLVKARIEIATKKVKDVRVLKRGRQKVAVIKTIIREKEQEGKK